MPVIEIDGEAITLKGPSGSKRITRDELSKLDNAMIERIADEIGERPIDVLRALGGLIDLEFLDHFRMAMDVLADKTLKPHEKMDFLATMKPKFKAWLISKLMEMPTVARRLKPLEKSDEQVPIAEFVLDKAKPEEIVQVMVDCIERIGLRFAKTMSGDLFLVNHSHLVVYEAITDEIVGLFDVKKKGLASFLEEVLRSRAKTIIVREDCNPPMLLPFQNAILDMSTWRWWPLTDSPPYFTYWIDCNLDLGIIDMLPKLDLSFWEAQCPKFLSLIKRLFPGENFNRCLEMLGSILIPSVLRRIFFVIGPPGVGKSTFAEVLVRALKGVCSTSSLEDLVESRFNWDLMGKLVNISTEGSYVFVDKKGIARLNRLTGDATLRFEKKYRNAVYGPNYLKLIFLLNELPLFHHVEEALLDRIYIIETTEEKVGEPRSIEAVVRDVLAEREQIIHFMLWCSYNLMPDGHVRYRHDMDVEEKRELLLSSMNPVNQWIDEECERDPNASENRKLLYSSYEMWAKRRGRPVMSKTAFYATLRSLGFREVKRFNEYYFKGLRLRDRGERSLV